MSTFAFNATVNGKKIEIDIKPNLRLLDLLRDVLNLTGTKEGCGEGEALAMLPTMVPWLRICGEPTIAAALARAL